MPKTAMSGMSASVMEMTCFNITGFLMDERLGRRSGCGERSAPGPGERGFKARRAPLRGVSWER